ncbi:MAG: hypothetical protein ABIK65_03680 [Candidatus Eisenbacteria bacterium]
MDIRSYLTKTIRTRSRRTLIIAGAAVVVAGGVLVLRGPVLAGAAGGGARWAVNKVVHAMTWREVSPGGEETAPNATVTGRVRLASGPPFPMEVPGDGNPADRLPLPEGEEEGGPSPKTDPVLEIPAPDLVTPLEEERKDTREELPPYRSFGLRDPMLPLVTAYGDDDGDGRFSVHILTLVGIGKQSGVRVALCEDPKRKSYLYRTGEWTDDGGRVVEITEDAITFAHVRYGETNRFTLRLEAREEEQQ